MHTAHDIYCLYEWKLLREMLISCYIEQMFKVTRGYLLDRRHPFLNRILGK